MDLPQTSSAQQPDLDWSQINETVRMLNLSVAQISMAMNEGDDSVGSLTDAFTSMVDSVNNIENVATSINDQSVEADAKASMLENCSSVQGKIEHAIIAFQFYDRLSQRLDHVKHALEQLSGIVTDRGRLYDPQAWTELQNVILSKYTMKEEQDMFDALIKGASVEEALEQVRNADHNNDDDIELF